MGFVFQSAALFDSMTVMENVLFGIERRESMRLKDRRARAEKALKDVGLQPEDAKKYPADLSGGMRKRVGLARALALDPKIVLYDEPTTGLDPITTFAIDRLVAGLRDNAPGDQPLRQPRPGLRRARRRPGGVPPPGRTGVRRDARGFYQRRASGHRGTGAGFADDLARRLGVLGTFLLKHDDTTRHKGHKEKDQPRRVLRVVVLQKKEFCRTSALSIRYALHRRPPGRRTKP